MTVKEKIFEEYRKNPSLNNWNRYKNCTDNSEVVERSEKPNKINRHDSLSEALNKEKSNDKNNKKDSNNG